MSTCQDVFSQLNTLCTPPPAEPDKQPHDAYSTVDVCSIGSNPVVGGYIFETHPSAIKLACIGAAFFSHPMHRLPQQEFMKRMSVDPSMIDTLRDLSSCYSIAIPTPLPTAVLGNDKHVETSTHKQDLTSPSRTDDRMITDDNKSELSGPSNGGGEESKSKKLVGMLFSSKKPGSGGVGEGVEEKSAVTESNTSSSVAKMKNFFGRL